MVGSVQNAYEIQFLKALTVTIAVEAVVIVILLHTAFFRKTDISVPWPSRLAAATIPSFATLPYLWFVLPAFIGTYLLRTILGEIGIVITELVMIRFLTGLPWWKSALLSFFANVLSIIIGLMVF
jgi:hypothetical protein